MILSKLEHNNKNIYFWNLSKKWSFREQHRNNLHGKTRWRTTKKERELKNLSANNALSQIGSLTNK
jgi:hypothetical protein